MSQEITPSPALKQTGGFLHRILESPVLEGIHKHHRVQLLTPKITFGAKQAALCYQHPFLFIMKCGATRTQLCRGFAEVTAGGG